MATLFTVTSTADDINNTGSLRYAISQALGGDVITFDATLAGQTITLTSSLVVNEGITIDGGSNNITITDGSPQAQTGFTNFVIAGDSANPITIQNLAINDGYGVGSTGAKGAGPGSPGGPGGNAAGAIFVQSGSLNLINSSFTNNTALGGYGGDSFNPNNSTKGAGGSGGNAAGAIYVQPGANVTTSNLAFVNNVGTGGSGGSYADPTGPDGTGYAISNDPNIVCYCAGTLIRTPHGDVAVEDLAIGNRIVTTSSEARSICWIGHRTVACKGRKEVLPVRISAHAFGDGRPARDLFVSPAHAIAVDVLGEVLIPAIRLVNGTTITQVDVETVTYWHVELDSHDILLAEGLPAESYLDCGNRRFFANAEATDLLAVPDARPEGPLPICRPFHEVGPVVDLVRTRLTDRAEALGWRKVEETFAGLHLVADGVVIRPDTDGLTARFVVPSEARDLRLVSDTSVPTPVVPGSTDDQRLGVALAALTIDDGLTGARAIALDDARLGEGFHSLDDGARWTDGSAVVPADLWAGCKGSFFLRVELAAPALPRWIAPGETGSVVDLTAHRRA